MKDRFPFCFIFGCGFAGARFFGYPVGVRRPRTTNLTAIQPVVAQYGSKLRSAGITSVPKSLIERIKSSSAMSPMLNSPRTVLNNPSAAAALIFSSRSGAIRRKQDCDPVGNRD